MFIGRADPSAALPVVLINLLLPVSCVFIVFIGYSSFFVMGRLNTEKNTPLSNNQKD
jgi:hypothetical protein